MNRFTAKEAREIVATESFSTKGYVIDQIKKAARNAQTNLNITDLKLTSIDTQILEADGFTIQGNNISWKE